ncbi:MAG: hypothetical protein LLF95_00915 [Bacteroidales bacterium]|nr:hypothetical protein [Bacteroidales bacterium]
MKKYVCVIIVLLALLSCSEDNGIDVDIGKNTEKNYEWTDYFVPFDQEIYDVRSMFTGYEHKVVTTCWRRKTDMSTEHGVHLFHKASGTMEYVDSLDYAIKISPSLRKIHLDNKTLWINDSIVICYDRYGKLSADFEWFTSDIVNKHKSSKDKKDKDGNLWLATQSGVKMYDGKKIEVFCPQLSFREIAIDNNGTVYANSFPLDWWGGEKGMLFKYDNHNWDTVATCANSFDWVSCMDFDKDNNLWIGVMSRSTVGIEYGGGMFKIDNSGTITHYHIYNSQLKSNSVVNIFIDDSDNKWITAYGGGAVNCFSNTGVWTFYEQYIIYDPDFDPVTLQYEFVDSDSEKAIWVTNQYEGLSKIELKNK